MSESNRTPDDVLLLLSSLREHRGSRRRLVRRFLIEFRRIERITDAIVLLRERRRRLTLYRMRGATLRSESIVASPGRPFAAGGVVTDRLPPEAEPQGKNRRIIPIGAGRSLYGALIVTVARPSAALEEKLDRFARWLAVAFDNVRLLEEARRESRLDPLTGIPNLRHLDEQIHLEIDRTRRFGGVFALLMIDLDHFKEYNDQFGHLEGNEALRRVATLFRVATRSIDVVGRYGGDEFLLILPGTGKPGAIEAGRRLVEKMHKSAGLAALSASAGVALFPEDGEEASELLRAADEALYRAKDRGGGDVAA